MLTPAQNKIFNLSTHQLAYERDDKLILSNINLSLKSGELLWLQGVNGAGKTTLIKLICGLLTPCTGEIYWKEQKLKEYGPEYNRELIYLGHKPAVKNLLTVAEQCQQWTTEPCALQKLNDILQQFDLLEKQDIFINQLSEGQRRRVALTQLLLRQAPLWLLDEPFTALDQKGIEFLLGLLKIHIQQGGMAIVSTHHEYDIDGLTQQTLRLTHD